MAFNIDDVIDKKKIHEIVNSAVSKGIDETIEKVGGDLENLFRSIIDDYYKYRTRMYVRHGNSKPGSGGSNLYNAMIVKKVRTKKKSGIKTDYDSDYMEGYDPSYISAFGKVSEINNSIPTDIVLDKIVMGERFNVGKWDFKANSEFFNSNAKTLDELDTELNNELSKVLTEVCAENIAKYLKEGIK